MVYPHFLKFLHNVELENVFPLLAEEFGRRLQAPPGQAEKKAMRRGVAWSPETFIAEPAPPFSAYPAPGCCLVTPPKLTWLHQEQSKESCRLLQGRPMQLQNQSPREKTNVTHS